MKRNIRNSPRFDQQLRKLDFTILIRVDKLIRKVIADPTIGKPMQYNRKGTRELYLKPFRLSYIYDPTDDSITFLELYHKKHQ